jgi:hypothetical protein
VLVPTVVPWRTSTFSAPPNCRTPSSTAREGSAGVEKIFFTRSFPSAKQTQSVNVPPVSIAMRKSARSSCLECIETIVL